MGQEIVISVGVLACILVGYIPLLIICLGFLISNIKKTLIETKIATQYLEEMKADTAQIAQCYRESSALLRTIQSTLHRRNTSDRRTSQGQGGFRPPNDQQQPRGERSGSYRQNNRSGGGRYNSRPPYNKNDISNETKDFNSGDRHENTNGNESGN